jgi:hypothetical protein
MKTHRGLLAAVAVAVALVVAPSAQAAIPSVYEGGLTCTAQPLNGDIRACEGATETWDGTKIDVNVFLPEAGGTEGPYPLIGEFHGWGGSKYGLKTEGPGGPVTYQQKDPRIQHWAEEGYAVFSMSDRGWGLSCGKYDPDIAEPECENGYNHLMDDRYEVRDAQYLISELAEEGIVEPKKIGVTGASYGGGMSIALAALRNRVMQPNGELVPWETEDGTEMEIAAAVPQWPWTDLAYAMAPNGRNLDYVTDSTYRGPEGNYPVGVMKYSWDEYLYKAGEALSNYNENDPEADIPGWILRFEAGEPYTDSSIQGIINELTTFHSSFYIEHSTEPSPLLIQSGWNDDLFPADEALRFYQRTRAQYPSDPISLFFADYGHARSQNKADAVTRFNQRLEEWFAHYLKGEGESPSSSVETMTTTCPPSEPSEGPFTGKDWSALSPGEIRLQSADAQTIKHGTLAEEKVPTESGAFFDPIVGPEYGKNACSTVSAADNPRAANYRLAAAPAGGYTLMGSPTIIANVEAPSPNSEIAARLLDESPSGEESLVARGLYRPTGGTQEMVFQLHPQGYHFATGHVAKLELLPSDLPYGRFSNLQTNITVSNLELRLPVMQKPGALGGLVQTPAAKVVPPGYTLAAEFETKSSGGGSSGGGGSTTSPTPPAPVVKIGKSSISGKLSATSTSLTVPMTCGGEGACSGQLMVTIKQSGKKTTLAKGSYKITAGKKAKVKLSLTKAGRKLVKSAIAKKSKTLTAQVQLDDSGQSGRQTSKRAVQLPRAH